MLASVLEMSLQNLNPNQLESGHLFHFLSHLRSSPPIRSTFTHSFTHSLTHLLAYSLTDSLTQSLTQSLTHSLTDSITHSLTHSLAHSLPANAPHLHSHAHSIRGSAFVLVPWIGLAHWVAAYPRRYHPAWVGLAGTLAMACTLPQMLRDMCDGTVFMFLLGVVYAESGSG